ncbi:transglycosylase domain-containing protein [Peterkaempfera bronchialis]|uniref:Penicillin-binding protein n=1 Tax=Peterkaempfera bronchialis TaxID=2126346 RepID=A0A345SYJ4_9ACTN|nr:transglycosylase domain-containing protein [Peterkaempfera bronchialis]AXI78799.1 penicillin-binding protein [Peterkaempfera bronchialis]
MAQKRSGSPLDKAKLAVNFAGASVLAGLLTAGLALPAAGALGLTAKNTADSFDSIPADFKTPPLSQASYIYDAKGGLIAKVYDRDRTIVKLDDIAPVMRQAQVDIEDARFYEHGAIDLKGVLRAITKNAESGSVQGASTLTQQYVKNVFVEQAGDDKDKFLEATRQTLGRKIQELKYAIKLEEDLTKDEILTNYLNITFFGNQAYGIEAAANRYFSTHAKDLTLPEAAMLAGLVQNPSAYDPTLHPQAAKTRRDTVIRRMADLKHITEAEAEKAIATPMNLKYSPPQNGCITAKQGMGFFCDYVRNVIKTDKVFGKTKADRVKLLSRGGLKIFTTLDPTAQESAQKAVTQKVYAKDPVAAAVTMVKPGTGRILAMAQSRPYGLDAKKGQTQVNFNVGSDFGTANGQQVGSTFKPITAAAAIDGGMPATQVFSSPNKMPYPNMSTCNGQWVNVEGAVVPNESASEIGPYAMQEAMAKSVNTYFVQMEQQIGICSVKKMAEKLGLGVAATGKRIQQVGALTLGTESFAPLHMSSAYAAFASRGTYCNPIAITSITYGSKRLSVPKSTCRRVMSEKTADTINTLLLGVTQDGTGTQAGLTDRQSAGKTGTTDGRLNAWFTGYTPDLAASVWLGDPMQNREMRNITIGGTYFSSVYGADGPGPIWRTAVSGALVNTPASQFTTVVIPKPEPPKPKNDDPKGDDKGDDNKTGDNRAPGRGPGRGHGPGQPSGQTIAGPGGFSLPPGLGGGQADANGDNGTDGDTPAP